MKLLKHRELPTHWGEWTNNHSGWMAGCVSPEERSRSEDQQARNAAGVRVRRRRPRVSARSPPARPGFCVVWQVKLNNLISSGKPTIPSHVDMTENLNLRIGSTGRSGSGGYLEPLMCRAFCTLVLDYLTLKIPDSIFSHENLTQTAWSSRVDSLPEPLISPPGLVKPNTTDTPFPSQPPARHPAGSRGEAGRGARGPGLHIPRACAASHEHTAHTPRTGTHEHACAPAPRQSLALRSYLRGSTGAGPTRACRLPLLSRRGPPDLSRRARGRLRSPPVPASFRAPRDPHSRRHPGVWGGRGLGAPGRALPSPALRPQGCSRGQRTAGEAAARAFPGQPAAGTGSHGARAGCGSGTRPRPLGGPSRGLCVSAGGAASRAGGR